MRRTSRRELLRAGGLAGVAGLSITPGCFGILGGGDGDGDGDRDGDDADADGGGGDGGETTTTAQPGAPTFRWWLPDPRELYDDPSYTVNYHDLAAFREHENALHSQTFKLIRGAGSAVAPTMGVTVGKIDGILQVGSSLIKVVTGSFDAGSVTDHLTSEGYSKTDDHQGYALYAGGSDFPVVAVGDEATLLCRSAATNEPTAVARMLIGAHSGDATRYHEASDDFDLATRDVTAASRVGASIEADPAKEADPQRGPFRGNVALGFGFTVGADTSDLLMVFVFSSEGLASADDVRTWTEEGLDGFQQYDQLSVSTEGRTVRIEGTTDTGQLDFIQPGPPGGEQTAIDP